MDSDEYDSSNSRRSSLAISALLNDDSVDPIIPHRQLTPEEKRENRKTWPGFTTPEDVPKAKRKRISSHQFNRLMEIFQQTDTPSSEVRENLAEELDMTKREVQVWFQNRRAKASRARNAAAALSAVNHNGAAPSTSSAMSARYEQYPWSENTNHHLHHQHQQHQQHHHQSLHPKPSPSPLALPPHPTAISSSTSSPLPPLASHHHHLNHHPYVSYTSPPTQRPGPPPRRASYAFSDASKLPLRSSSLSTASIPPPPPAPPPQTSAGSASSSSASLQPIAPRMPPPSRPLSASAASLYNHRTPSLPTPPHVQSIAPRKHSIHQGFENLTLQNRDHSRQPAKKRPKSVIL